MRMPALFRAAKQHKDKQLYFYSNLAKLMANKGLNIASLSEKTGVDQSTIRSLIRGRLKRIYSLPTGKLVKFFDCQLEDLYVIKWE